MANGLHLGSQPINNVDMAKKKSTKPDPHKAIQLPFRVIDPALIEAIEEEAKETRRSRNMTINMLLEEALQLRGRWPRKPKKDS
jgi:hypothetical protein